MEAALCLVMYLGNRGLKVEESILAEFEKAGPRKQILAGWNKSRYSVTNAWLAEKLHMG